MNIERSRSFYVLTWVEGGVNKDQIERLSINTFGSVEFAGIEQRLNEQKQRGLIFEKHGLYDLTLSGQFMVKVSNLIAATFNLQEYKRIREIKLDLSG